MKHFLFLLSTVLFFGVGFGQVTVTYDFSSGGAVSGINEAAPGIALDANIGFGSFKNSGTSNPGIFSNQLRLYQSATKGGSIIIYASNGVTITDVVVNASSRTGDAGFIVDGGTATNLIGGTTYTMSGLNAVNEVEFFQRESGSDNRIYIDDFTVTYTLAATNDTDSEIYDTGSQPAAATILSTDDTPAEAVNVFDFTIEDMGSGDGLATQVTNINLKPHTSNTADWTDHLAGVIVKQGATTITTGSVSISDTEINIPITAGNLDIADGTAEDVEIYVYLNTSNIVDGAIFSCYEMK